MTHTFSVPFWSSGTRLAGRVFRNPTSLDVRQPGIIVTGSWLTVKERMPEVYATRLAERGYTAFTLRTVRAPVLFVHSDGCVFPDNLRSVDASLQGPKQLEWLTGGQTDFYDQPEQVERAVSLADSFLTS